MGPEPCLAEHGLAAWRGRVILSDLAIDQAILPLEEPLGLHGMEERIEHTGAQVIAVALKLFEHPQAIDGFLPGVMENVHFDEAQKELSNHRIVQRSSIIES